MGSPGIIIQPNLFHFGVKEIHVGAGEMAQ